MLPRSLARLLPTSTKTAEISLAVRVSTGQSSEISASNYFRPMVAVVITFDLRCFEAVRVLPVLLTQTRETPLPS